MAREEVKENGGIGKKESKNSELIMGAFVFEFESLVVRFAILCLMLRFALAGSVALISASRLLSLVSMFDFLLQLCDSILSNSSVRFPGAGLDTCIIQSRLCMTLFLFICCFGHHNTPFPSSAHHSLGPETLLSISYSRLGEVPVCPSQLQARQFASILRRLLAPLGRGSGR